MPALVMLAIFLVASPAAAVLVVNSPAPIISTVTVQPIILSDTDGSNTAEFFGTSAQQSSIESLVDTIWAQAGIDVTFLTPDTWNHDFANMGTSPPLARPTTDLAATVSAANTAGKLHSDPNVINMFFVEIAAGFPFTSNNTANGLAFVGGNGVSQHVGDLLPGFLAGREVIANVVSHEIGHNLGLFHIVEIENLMQAGGSPDPGHRLNSSQIATALASSFSVSAIPEPSAFWFLSLVGFGVLVVRQSRCRRLSV